MTNFPENQWIEVPSEELAKIGKTQWVYKPSNHEPMAFDAKIVPQGHIVQIHCSKELKKIYGLPD